MALNEIAKSHFFEPPSAHCNSVSATRKDNRDTVVPGRTFTESGGETEPETDAENGFAIPCPSNVGFPNKRPSAWPKAARSRTDDASLPPSGLFPNFPAADRPTARPRAAPQPTDATFGTLECRCPFGRQFLPEDLIVSDSPPPQSPHCIECPRPPVCRARAASLSLPLSIAKMDIGNAVKVRKSPQSPSSTRSGLAQP